MSDETATSASACSNALDVLDALIRETAETADGMAGPGFDEIGAGAGVGVRLKALGDARAAIVTAGLRDHETRACGSRLGRGERISGLGTCSKCDDHNNPCVCRMACSCGGPHGDASRSNGSAAKTYSLVVCPTCRSEAFRVCDHEDRVVWACNECRRHLGDDEHVIEITVAEVAAVTEENRDARATTVPEPLAPNSNAPDIPTTREDVAEMLEADAPAPSRTTTEDGR